MIFNTALDVFIAIVETGSFTKAAKKVGMSGAAVGKHVHNLEQKLNLRLFHRTTRIVTPTDAAMKLYEAVSSSRDYLSEVIDHISQEQETPSGRLKINVPMSYGEQYLAKPLAAFAARYPDVIVDVDFDDKRVHLIEEGYDLVVRIGVLEDSGLIAKRISDFEIILCAAPALLEEYGEPSMPQDIAGWPMVCYSNAPNPAVFSYSDPTGQTQSVTLSPKLYANSASMMTEACLKGVGVALLPQFTCKHAIHDGLLKPILEDFPQPSERGVYVVYPDKQFTPLKVRRFIDILSEFSSLS